MSLPINSSNIEGLFGTLYNDPFSNTNNLVKEDKNFNNLLYNTSLDVSLYPSSLDASARPYVGSTAKYSLPPLPPKPYMANLNTSETPSASSKYVPPGLKHGSNEQSEKSELESLSDLESSTSAFTFDEQFKNDNLIMEPPLPRKRSLCHHTETCNNSSCEFSHLKIWYKKQNHFLRILHENKKEIDIILKYRIKTFPKLMSLYMEQLSFHNKLADLAKHFANVTKNDESYLTLDFETRKQTRMYGEDNQGDGSRRNFGPEYVPKKQSEEYVHKKQGETYVHKKQGEPYVPKKQGEPYVPKNQNEDGDYKGDYNPKRNYVTNYTKTPLSGSSIWRKVGGGND
jgi:hypothetical protein